MQLSAFSLPDFMNYKTVDMQKYLTFTMYCKTIRKYGVRFPKFIWVPCAQLYSLAETP
jgi:hypothetical protein